MNDPVLCPWCNHEMIHQRESRGMRFGIDYLYCGGCGASSPRICTDDGNWDGKIEQAIAAAQKRYVPPFKPLTLKELEAPNLHAPVWIEERTNALWMGARFSVGDTPYMWRCGTGEANRLSRYYLEKYGETWRCWPRKPTDEERRAVGWERGGDSLPCSQQS